MKHLPAAISVALVVLASLSLAACGATPAEEALDSPLPAPTRATSGLAVVDALGRTIEFPVMPQRIVVAGKSSLTLINTLYLFPEARERVVGLVVGSQKPGDFLAFVDPTFGQKVNLEVEAGPEQIAPLKPDAVILRSFMAEKLGGPLEQLGIPVVYVDLETPEQFLRDVGTLGQLLANEARAQEIQSFYESRLETVQAKLQGQEADERPSILIVQHSDQGGEVALNIPSASWIQTTEAELAGGNPVWKEAAQGGGWSVVNVEQIAVWNPDKIFVISYKSDSAAIVDGLKANPQWQALKAVQEDQIYGFAADIFSWDQPDPRWILGVTWLAGKVHPERFGELDIMQEVSQFFGQMYGMDRTSIEEQIVPQLKGDIE
jgi:iron complex transport system substrate-binding protein